MSIKPTDVRPFVPTTSAACCARRSCARRFARTPRRRSADADFRAAQDAAIRDVVKLQEDCGLQVVTDGEFRRISYWEKFVRLTKGLVVKDAVFKFHDEHGHESDFTAPYVAARCRAPNRSRSTSTRFARS